MSYRVLKAADAFWRPSNMLKVDNTDLAKQLEADTLGARLWRLKPGEWSTKHRHTEASEMYVLLEGTGKLRIGEEVLTLDYLDAVWVEPDTVRQPFNDTEADQLWLVVGAPVEKADTTTMSDEEIEFRYPDGPKVPPPELSA